MNEAKQTVDLQAAEVRLGQLHELLGAMRALVHANSVAPNLTAEEFETLISALAIRGEYICSRLADKLGCGPVEVREEWELSERKGQAADE